MSSPVKRIVHSVRPDQSPKRQRGVSSERSPARPPAICAPNSAAWRARIALLTCLPCAALFAAGCTLAGRGPAREASRFYPPPPQTPRVVALGTLRGAPPPSQAETDLALFLFGAEPPPALTIANPTALAADAQGALVCDGALDTVFVWDATTNTVAEARLDPPPDHPCAVDLAPDGTRLICDRAGVQRYDAAGNRVRSYVLDPNGFKPGSALLVGTQVWATNLAAHRIEVFDADTGQHVRSIGERGSGPAQFSLPRAMARTPDGQVCVVDMLNCRVQILDADGRWLRDIGGRGDVVGSFGRPKGIAVADDGTIFVTDAFSQRVQVFSPDGQPLLAFGEPGSGPGALLLPSGIAVTAVAPRTEHALSAGTAPAYYLLVAEELDRPGLRVYGWLQAGAETEPTAAPAAEAVNWKPRFPGSAAINPHWDATRCTKCHESEGDRLLPIAAEKTDALCISCHDGTQAPADPHPIGRDAQAQLVSTPPDFPTVAGAIGCLTCHDIQRHCHVGAKRPAVNTVLLRNYDPQRPLEYCSNCHRTDVGGRFSPHRQRDATGKVREDACLFCHTQRPEIPEDGRRRFEPHLRAVSSALCLNCHARHWDLSPLGHVDRPVKPQIRAWMIAHESATSPNAPAPTTGPNEERAPARLPLGDDRVTCYTCHNPHYNGLFPPDSELGTLASNPAERRSALRANWIDLCLSCHAK